MRPVPTVFPAGVEVDVNGCTIFDMSGVERQPVTGTLAAEELAEILVESWIPYFECHGCGRWRSCPYVVRHQLNPHRALDIKCGVAAKALEEFAARTARLASGRPVEDVQAWLDAAWHFFKFVYGSELQNGVFLSGGLLDHYGDLAPMVFGQILSLRDHLDEMARLLARFPEYRSLTSVLLVEGESELAFIQETRRSGLAAFLNFGVRSYQGKGNAQKRKIELLLRHYRERGVTSYVQGDADGRAGGPVQSLVDHGLIPPERAFVFSYDFETAVPPALLLEAIQRLPSELAVGPSDFIAGLAAEGGPVLPAVLRRWGVDLEGEKVRLAREVARLLRERDLFWDDELLATELGSFLTFLTRL